MLDVAEEILNRCAKLDPECDVNKEEYRVAFNYEFIEDAQTPCTEGSGNEDKSVALFNPVAASNGQSGGSANG